MNTSTHKSPWIDNLNFNWSSLYQYSNEVDVPKGSVLYHCGDVINYVYIILKGRVQLNLLNEEGKEKTVAIIGEKGLLGEYKKAGNTTYVTNAVTVSHTTLIKIEKTTFESILIQDSFLAQQRLEMLSIKVELLANASLDLSFNNSFSRVVQMFLFLANDYGKVVNKDVIKILITFTHQEIADLIGTTRVTVASVIKSLTSQKIIKKEKKHYYILDINKFQDLLK